jgi:biopolymer transport protein ExbD
MAMAVPAGRRKVIAEINVTPMADVMIVLLIIFMVTAPILAGPPVRLPPAANPLAQRGERIEIVVKASGEIAVGGLSFSGPESLAAWLAARRDSTSAPVVLVQADRGLGFAAVAPVLAACRQAGAFEVALATERRPRPF